MRRVASLAGLLALVWIALSSAGAPSAKAGWAGWQGPYGGWPDLPSACKSWQWNYGTYAGYRIIPNPGNIPIFAQCMYVGGGIWNTNPICPYGDWLDAYMTDGCAPPNTAPPPRELGYSCPFCGNPISVVGGNKFEVATDFETPTPDKLAFKRYYNSGNPLAQTTMLAMAGARSSTPISIRPTAPRGRSITIARTAKSSRSTTAAARAGMRTTPTPTSRSATVARPGR